MWRYYIPTLSPKVERKHVWGSYRISTVFHMTDSRTSIQLHQHIVVSRVPSPICRKNEAHAVYKPQPYIPTHHPIGGMSRKSMARVCRSHELYTPSKTCINNLNCLILTSQIHFTYNPNKTFHLCLKKAVFITSASSSLGILSPSHATAHLQSTAGTQKNLQLAVRDGSINTTMSELLASATSDPSRLRITLALTTSTSIKRPG